jgi:putative FmdB family regulatory protein
MPIYEYECKKCGRIREAWQTFSEKPLKTCEQCSGRLHKLISQSTFHLKGTGWYVTDYADNKSSGSSPKSKTKKTDTPPESSKKPESKKQE